MGGAAFRGEMDLSWLLQFINIIAIIILQAEVVKNKQANNKQIGTNNEQKTKSCRQTRNKTKTQKPEN